MLLLLQMFGSQRFLWVSFRILLDSYYCGVMNGLHHSGQAAAQVVGLVDVNLWWIFQHHRPAGAVQNPRQQLAQLYLQRIYRKQKNPAEMSPSGGSFWF